MEKKLPKILISVVDDDEAVRQGTSRLVRSFGFAVEVSSCAEDFLRSDRLLSSSCLILDVRMGGMSGLELQKLLAKSGYRIPTIFITAYPDEQARARALQTGAVAFLSKPFTDEALLNAIHSALKLSGGPENPANHDD